MLVIQFQWSQGTTSFQSLKKSFPLINSVTTSLEINTEDKNITAVNAQ